MNQSGHWWRTMGLTKTHLIGVFATESFLCLIASVMAMMAVSQDGDHRRDLLLGAILMAALACAVLLSSILALLFYKGFSDRDQASVEID